MQKRVKLSICEDLIVNSLLESLEDSSVINKRLTLDLIKNSFNIKENNEKVIILMKETLKLFKGKDHSLIRRLWEWAFPEEINHEQVLIVRDVMKKATVLVFKENHEIIQRLADDKNEVKLLSLKIVDEIIESEGIGEEFIIDIAIPLIIHAIEDKLYEIEGPYSRKLFIIIDNHRKLF